MKAQAWFAMGLFAFIAACIWVFTFIHHSETNFSVAVGSTGVLGGVYHWIVERKPQ